MTDGSDEAVTEGLVLLVTVGDAVGLGVTGEAVGEDDGVLEATAEGIELGSEELVTDGSEDAVIDGLAEAVTDGLALLVTVGNGVGLDVTGDAVGEDEGLSE